MNDGEQSVPVPVPVPVPAPVPALESPAAAIVRGQGTSVWSTIEVALAADIEAGRFAPGERLPSEQVLATHDENYMPPEAADALAKARKGQLPGGAMTVSSDESNQKANP